MYHKFLPISVITLVIFLFFFHLFLPSKKLFATPDFGQSDIWSLNLPAKKFLSDSLKDNQWPLWNPYIANGYPQLAEGQIGTFYIPNLLLFKYAPFVDAYNLGYGVTFFIAAIGMYLFARSLKFTQFLSIFASLTFAFSGYFVTHMSHYNLLQTSALFPVIFFAVKKSLDTKKIAYFILYTFVLTQQIFTGFPQTTLITLVSATFFSIFIVNPELKKNVRILLILLICTVLAFLMAAIQLLPQSQFLKTSTRDGGLPSTLSANYSFPFSHLLTMLDPTILGTPEDGSYQMTKAREGIIYWENSGFIGTIPFILALCSVFLFKKNRFVQCFIILTVISLFLMTGKYSPLYFVYSFPPLTFFRVPSRFILPFFFSCIMLSLYTLKYIQNRYAWGNRASILVVLFSLYQIFHFAYGYNPTIEAGKILKDPDVKKIIKGEEKTLSLGSALYWNKYFYSKGWENPDIYLRYKNALTANQNVLYDMYSVDVYRSQVTKRFDLTTGILTSLSYDNKTASPSTQMINMGNIYGIDYLISGVDVSGKNELTKVEELGNNPTFRIYKYNNSRPDQYVTTNLFKAETVNEVKTYLNSPMKNIHENPVIVSQDLPEIESKQPKYSIQSSKKTNTQREYKVESNTHALLVVNQSYDENWHAKVNGQKTKTFPVNINQIGILVPKGNSFVELNYYPGGWNWGKALSFALPVLLCSLLFLKLLKRKRRISI